jgi:hypothetical protein
MNETIEIDFVPKGIDGMVKAKPTRRGTIDKSTQPGGPILGIAKKVIPKKHPPRTSGSAALVDKKIAKSCCRGQNVERNSDHERVETTNHEECNSGAHKAPMKHPPSRETRLVHEAKRVKDTIAEFGTIGSIIPRKHPSREYSLDLLDGKKDRNAEGADPKGFTTPRKYSQELRPDLRPLKDTDRDVSKICRRQSLERKLSRQSINDKCHARSTERKNSTTPGTNRSLSHERKHSAPPGTSRCRTRSTERTKLLERNTSKEPSLGKARERSIERKLSSRARSTERTKSLERKSSKEPSRGTTRERSIERKLSIENNQEKIRPRPVERKPSKNCTRQRSPERKPIPMVPTNYRPKSEELVPYRSPIKGHMKDRTRSKSADRITRQAMERAEPFKAKATPLYVKADEALLVQSINKEEDVEVENDKPRGPEIIELSKQSTSSNDETLSTSEDDASCSNNSTSCTDDSYSSKDAGKFLTRRVSFGNVDVQEFAYSLGCNVVTRNGPPVSIAQSPLRSKRIDVDSFEKDRSLSRRRRDDLLLSEVDRIIILQRCGYTAEEIEEACWDAEKVRKQRLKSIKYKDWDGWNAASESLARKIAKISSAKDLLFRSS